MSQPNRFAPRTQLDVLRALLARFSATDKGFADNLGKSLASLQQLALKDLGPRLAGASCPPALRKCLLDAIPRFPWPEWEDPLVAMLLHEEDLALFDQGCSVLGGFASRGALKGLMRLKDSRKDPERQEILDRELHPYLMEQPLEACFDALLVGRTHPELARLGACGLASKALPEHVDQLAEAFRQGDEVVRPLALQLLASLRSPASGECLLHLMNELETERIGLEALAEFLQARGTLTEKAWKEQFQRDMEAAFPASHPLLAALWEHLAHPAAGTVPDLTSLEPEARGAHTDFLMKALGLWLEGRMMQFGSLPKETMAGLPAILAERTARIESLAALLATLAAQGQLPLDRVLPRLEEATRANPASEGLLMAYLRLLPGGDEERLRQFLGEPEGGRRKRIYAILGSREDDLLAGFFLQAMNDADPDLAKLAMRQLEKLPSGFPGMMELFRSGQPDRMREAIHCFSENQSKEAVKPLTTFLSSDPPDDLLVDAVVALGHIGDPASANPLLRQLHAGKPLALQCALAEALGQLRTPVASLGLLKKAEELTLPEVLLASLKGSISAFPSFEIPFPTDQVPALEHLVERCCDPREGAGLWMVAAKITEGLFVFDQGLYDRLLERFRAFQIEMRSRPGWDRRSHDAISEIIRLLARRASKLSTLEDRERQFQALLDSIPESGRKRQQMLYQVQEIVADPDFLLGDMHAKALIAFLAQAMGRKNLEFEEVQLLCEIAEATKREDAIPMLEDLYEHGASPGVRGFARKALLSLGLSEAEIISRKPIQSILLLEPNAFFRQRILKALEGQDRNLQSCGTRQEAQALLAERSVDLLITETHDPMGHLWLWLESKWEHRQCRYVLLSCSSHDLGPLAEKPWVIGRLYKPYPMEELLQVLEG